MNTLILASRLFCYEKTRSGLEYPIKILNINGIVNNMRDNLKKQENFVFVASDPDNYEKTDMFSSLIIESFDMTLPFNNYSVLDNRTKDRAKEMLEEADLIFLCGGHVPTQNKFFEDIGLKNILKNLDCLIVGESAGSMNMAEVVYAEPERDGESLDPNYKTFLNGLGLTKISVLPHFLNNMHSCLDGKDVLNEITLPNSYIYPFFAISDGDYIMQKDGKITVFGCSVLIEDGVYQMISKYGELDITKLANAIYDNEELKSRIK